MKPCIACTAAAMGWPRERRSAAVLAFVAEFSDPGKGMATLGFAILGVILVNGLFSFWQEYRTEQAIAALEKLLPYQVKVVREGRVLEMPAHPLAREVNPDAEEELIHSKNILLAGTSMVFGQARALVFATGMHTEFGKIAHLTQTTGEVLSPLQKEIIHLSRVVAVLAAGLGLIFFLIGQMLALSFWENFIFVIGIIVANVPEGLLPTVTLALAMGSQRMAKRKRPDPPSAGGGSVGRSHGDLYRQDGYAHPESHDGEAVVFVGAVLR